MIILWDHRKRLAYNKLGAPYYEVDADGGCAATWGRDFAGWQPVVKAGENKWGVLFLEWSEPNLSGYCAEAVRNLLSPAPWIDSLWPDAIVAYTWVEVDKLQVAVGRTRFLGGQSGDPPEWFRLRRSRYEILMDDNNL